MSQPKPHFLHPSSIVFLLMARVRGYLIPAILAAVAAASGGRLIASLLIGFFVVALAVDIVRLFTLRYYFAPNELVVRMGLLFRQQRTIPYGRIQNIDLIQNPLHRLLGVAEARVETASGKEPEATLRVLSLTELDRLRRRLRAESTDPAGEDKEVDPVPAQRTLLTISPAQLVTLGLISNRGMVLVGIVCGAFYELELYERLDWGWAQKAARAAAEQISPLQRIVYGLLLLVAAWLLLRLLSVIWYLLRFYDYRLTTDEKNENLRVSGGLFTRVSATVPKRRVQFISIHRSLFARWLGLASIRIETAGGAASADEDARATITRRWFVPTVRQQDVPALMREIRGGLQWDEAEFHWHGVHRQAGRRLTRKAVLLSVASGLLGLLVWQPFGALLGLLVLPPLIWHARRYAASLKYARFDHGVVYRSGILTKKMSVTFFDKMQVIDIWQSPFDRRWQMACLNIDTAAAGPAEHRVRVQLLDQQFAREEFDAIAHRAAQGSW
jgi:putative membrane protein